MTSSSQPPRKSLMWIVRLLVAAASIGLVVAVVDVQLLWERVQDISLPVVALALAVNLVRQAFIAWRWKLMNTASTGHRFHQYFLYILASRPAGLLMPGLLGFDLARGVMIGQSQQENRAESLVSVLSDRVIGLASVIGIGMLATLVAPQFPSRMKYVGLLALLLSAFVIGLLVSASKPVYRLLSKVLGKMGGLGAKVTELLALWMRIVAFFRQHPLRVAKALAACALIHMSWFVIAWVLSENLGLGLSFFVITTVTALSWVVLAVPVSWMGLGVNEMSFIFLLSFQGVSRESAAALSIHQTVINVAFSLLCIPLLLLVAKRKRK